MADATADATWVLPDPAKADWVSYDADGDAQDASMPLTAETAEGAEGAPVSGVGASLPFGIEVAEAGEGSSATGLDASMAFAAEVAVGAEGKAGGVDGALQLGAETAKAREGPSAQGTNTQMGLSIGTAVANGPWPAPWHPADRSLDSLTGGSLGYVSDPTFYLKYAEPHDIPKRIKDNWSRPTEATY
jgi:hypothetical protein